MLTASSSRVRRAFREKSVVLALAGCAAIRLLAACDSADAGSLDDIQASAGKTRASDPSSSTPSATSDTVGGSSTSGGSSYTTPTAPSGTATATTPDQPAAPTSTTPAGWTLSWSDEFEGSAVDRSKWGFDTGGGGWGNSEREYYTDRATNAAVTGGMLHINALRESMGGESYTSARLLTRGKFDQTLGRFEARIKIPSGQGIWPAFWMLGSNLSAAGWPACGEIDIMENIGKDSETKNSYGTVHGPEASGSDYFGGAGIGSRFQAASRLTDDFHVYAVEWTADTIKFFVDEKQTLDKTTGAPKTISKSDMPSGAKWVFGDHSFFILLNVAVGGLWPGDPTDATQLPQTMLVDYVRVYKKS